jgi:hypothetical protein
MAIDIELLHTTPMGEERIRRNLGLTVADVVTWCKSEVGSADTATHRTTVTSFFPIATTLPLKSSA